ncbi:hypothetical protein LWI29_032356 [Acer saccharum]|uniref:Uncharacterized protein n=1 Tax=Acer saccharum TaxID=4024 RepID=A0AA39RFE8_ACESA|nr:hypothetical protein LWI29_032356 [Acer saccharum]
MEYFKRRGIMVERGIAVQELEDTPIPQVVEMRGWETFTSSPLMYCRKVVEEFYSRMVPEYFQQHGSVLVRGVDVRMTIADINKVHKGRQAVASSPLSRGPMIDPDVVELQAVMKLSRKEHEEMMRAELDPRGKRTSTEAEKESLDED